MPDAALTVKNPPEFELKVGSPKENYIAFAITANHALKNLSAEITIPCGTMPADKAYLCADGRNARLTIKCDRPKTPKFNSLQPLEASVGWKSSLFSLQAGETVTITITGFNPQRGGNAAVQLKIANAETSNDQAYPVSIKAAPGPVILYFAADSTNALKGSMVRFTSITTEARTVKLYAESTEVPPKSPSTKGTVTETTYTHKLTGNTTFYLKAWRTDQGKDDQADIVAGNLVERTIIVNAVERGTWYSADLLANSLGPDRAGETLYPTLLLKAKDLSGETTGDKLYGIFVSKGGHAGLWSSSSGLEDWRYLTDIPEGMAESPGVIHDGVLWLIGGSSINPLAPASNRICCYYKPKDGKPEWKEWDNEVSRTPAPRICHACSFFQDKIWVLGGLSDQNQPLDDVWTCTVKRDDDNFTLTWKSSTPLPTKRCLPVVTTTPGPTGIPGVTEPRLWLCGGATHPYNLDEAFYDFYWTDGTAWKALTAPEGNTSPLAETIFYDEGDKFLYLAGSFRGSKDVDADFRLRDLSLPNPWKTGSLSDFEWKEAAELFLIRSVAFRERWFFLPVYQDQAGTRSYSARIYVTSASK
jgi:Kelch motif